MSVDRADGGTHDVRHARDLFTCNLLREAALASDPADRQRLFEQAVLLNQPLARALAHYYHRRGFEHDDLLQVAMLGLVKAVRGYSPGAETAFAAYAVPTIRGEIRRHFRDRGWMIRPPRRLQELSSAVRIGEPQLAQRLQRMPTTAELADYLGVDADAVKDAQEAGGGYSARSLDSPAGQSGQLLGDVLADPEDPIDLVDAFLSLQGALKVLGARERSILRLRFVDNLTQEQIGYQLGVSQMQVSRLLSATLEKLRKRMQDQQVA